ncbi:thermonuclease family protein [Methylobacillus gramineus]|uniref:thermonuclease family protein n=1 Tax=Methylobacillus gramineus TaxID=755169 RepID=UPI001CFFD8A8|nr:thermonuclease family protein [Methylobacillus gramineus]MCB5185024.1 thermonuclease family protein [Methylobacillus gramineus]
MLLGLPSYADTLTGKVIGIADGDTLTILTSDKQSIKVRLNAIDAPEKAQDFGNASKKSLSSLCFGKPALIDLQGTDKYGRTIVALQCQTMDGSYHDANLHQVQNGMAWVYRQGSSDKQLIAAEESAKASSIGLWSQPNPMPPWEFRNGNAKIAKKATQVVQDVSATSKAGLACAGKRFCKQMASCAEARFYLNVCGVSQLDRNNDGIPCESICR